MTTDTSAPVMCARHPNTPTDLRCSRCETPICPRCIVQTPVGARCPDCGKGTPAPMYQVTPVSAARIVSATIAIGLGIGLLWGLLLPAVGAFGFFTIFLGAFAGYGMVWLMDKASGRKRGPWVQVAAAGCLVLAYVVRNAIVFGGLIVPNDLWGIIFIGIAGAVAWNQLR